MLSSIKAKLMEDWDCKPTLKIICRRTKEIAMLHQTEINDDEHQRKRKDLFERTNWREWYEVVCMYEIEEMAPRIICTRTGDTALHVAVSDGREDIVQNLVKILVNKGNEAALKQKNEDGNTPLHLAAAIGSVEMCDMIVKENNSLVEIRNNEGETPFFLAASCGNKNAFLNLHSYRNDTGNRYTNCRRKDGETILHCAIDGEYFDLAYQIIHLYEDLFSHYNKRGLSPLHCLAMKPSVFRSGCHIRRFNKIIYHCTFVDKLTTESQKEPEKALTSEVISNIKRSNSPDVEAPTGENQKRTFSDAERNGLVPDNYVTCFDFAKLVTRAMLMFLRLGSREINKIREEKEKHTWSFQIMDQLVKLTTEYSDSGRDPRQAEGTEVHESDDDRSPYFNILRESSVRLDYADGERSGKKSEGMMKNETPFLLAAQNGVVEMVEVILKRFRQAIYDTNEEGKNAVLLAAENRQAQVYKLLLDWDSLDNTVFWKVDKKGNSALHLAANLVGSNSSWKMAGPAFAMMLERKWYEYVMDSKPVSTRRLPKPVKHFHRCNESGESPRQIFTKTHVKLLKSGEEWLTKTSQSCSTLAAVIATIAFASAVTVPGGNDQSKGTPLLVNRAAFSVFSIASLFALGFSISSLVMFLAILTSGYLENDFRTSLPRTLLLGLTSLYICIGAMLVAFCAGHFLVLNDHLKYAAFPIYALTWLPVSLFAAVQFTIYFDLMRATFMEVPLSSYIFIPDSTQRKPADDKIDQDTAQEKKMNSY